MDKRIVALAFGPALVASGCMLHPPVMTPAAAAKEASSNQVIDFSRGAKAAPGYGTVTLDVSGLDDVHRSDQSLTSSTGAVLICAVTTSQNNPITDGNGDQAVYAAKVSGGTAAITLPPLPPTAAIVTPNTPTASADIFSTFLVTSGFPITAPGTSTYAVLGKYGQYTAHGGTEANPLTGDNHDTFKWDELDADMLNGPDNTQTLSASTSAYLEGSGEVMADVAPGYPEVVPLINWYQLGAAFAETNSTLLTEGYTAGDESAVNVSGFTITTGTPVHLRYPEFASASFPVAIQGSTRSVELVTNFTTAPTATVSYEVDTFDNTDPHVASQSANLTGDSFVGMVNGTSEASQSAEGNLLPVTLGMSDSKTTGLAEYHEVAVDNASTSNGCLDITLTGLNSGASFLLLDPNASSSGGVQNALGDNLIGVSLFK